MKPIKRIKPENLAVFLGRFQPFHIGHMSIVDKILKRYDRLILVIGSAEKSGTEDNPWTLQEREAIIRASIPLELQERIDIAGLGDVPDDDIWAENFKLLVPPDKTVFTGNQWVRDICERHGLQTEWIDAYEIDISGTKIRKLLQEKSPEVARWVLVDPEKL